MKKVFKKNNGRKRRKLNMIKQKAVIIPDRIFQANIMLFVTVNPQNSCTLEISDH